MSNRIVKVPLSIANALILLQVYYNGVHGKCSSTTQKIPAYPSGTDIRSFVIHMENKTWIDAYYSCNSQASTLHPNLTIPTYEYVKSVALKNGWATTQDIWVGIFKSAGNEDWINSRNCLNYSGIPVRGATEDTQQCVLLNMTSSSVEGLLYAAPCSLELPYLCTVEQGLINDTTDAYNMYPGTYINEANVEIYTDEFEGLLSIDECITDFLFKEYSCFGIEYDSSNNECTLFCTNIQYFPAKAYLKSTSDPDIYTVLKNTSKVVLSEMTVSSIINNTNDAYPCMNKTNTTEHYQKVNKTCVCPIGTIKSNGDKPIDIYQMQMDLKLRKYTLSSYKRLKISAADDRISSQTIGGFAVTILVTSLLLIVACDIPIIFNVETVRLRRNKARSDHYI